MLSKKYPEELQLKNIYNESILIHALNNSTNVAILDILLPFSSLEDKNIALYIAVLKRKMLFIQRLVDVGADPDAIIEDENIDFVSSPRNHAFCMKDDQILTIFNGTNLKPARISV